MKSSVTSNVVLVGLIAGLASVCGCSSGGNGGGNPFPSTGGTPGTAGSGGKAGSTAGSGGAAGQTTGGSSGGGTAGSSEGGKGGTGGSAGAAAGGTAGGGGGTSGVDAGANPDQGTPPAVGMPVTAVVPTLGCGKDPTGTGNQTIDTMGTKPADAADGKKGPWTYTRRYSVRLPANYDKNKPYNLVFVGQGCNGNEAPSYSYLNNVDATAILVGLAPLPVSAGLDHSEVHATAACFDDKEKYSVEIEYYEGVYDRLASNLCFDRNRVFMGGNSSGGWLSNELGCKYAGDPQRPIRGILPNTGGLPQDQRLHPACSGKPFAAFWTHDRNDTENPFGGTQDAIANAMKANGCTIGTSYDTSMRANYPIGGGNPDTLCQKILGCPDLYPLIVCVPTGTGHSSHDNIVNPGGAAFIKMFSAGAFLTN